MPILRNTAIKHKLIFIIMLTHITGMSLAGVALFVWERGVSRSNMMHNLSTQAEMIAENCKASLVFHDAKDAEETLRALRVEPSIVFGCVYNKEGKLFADYYNNYAEPKGSLPNPQQSDGSFAEDYLTVFRPIVLDGETIGTVCLRSDLSPMYAMLKRNTSIVIAVLFLSSSMALLMSSRLQKIISEPILSLAKVTKGVSEEKDYSVRAIKYSNDEVGLLIDAFNEMLEQIQQRDSELMDAKDQLETRVEERTAELTTANEQLKRFNKLAVGRELRMIKLKQEINNLLDELNREPKYRTDFDEAENAPLTKETD